MDATREPTPSGEVAKDTLDLVAREWWAEPARLVDAARRHYESSRNAHGRDRAYAALELAEIIDAFAAAGPEFLASLPGFARNLRRWANSEAITAELPASPREKRRLSTGIAVAIIGGAATVIAAALALLGVLAKR